MNAAPDQRRTDHALAQLLALLKQTGYHFITPTPATHARVIARACNRKARDLRGIFGWSLPFEPGLPEPALLASLDAAGMVRKDGDLLRSQIRVSSRGADLFLHSAYPTEDEDSVFFGPDSYRFADLIARELGRSPPAPGSHIVDIGTGAGVGAVTAARFCRGARLTMTDVNPQALAWAAINCRAAGVDTRCLLSEDLAALSEPIDVALANPPYIVDPAGRDYRDGGEQLGGAVALDMARQAIARLAPAGRLILYTGSAIVDGADPLRDALAELAAEGDCTMRYDELDPDVFGEELTRPAYAEVERIAVVSAIMERSAARS